VNASAWDEVSDKVRLRIDREVEETALKIKSEMDHSKPQIKTRLFFNVMRKMQGSNTWNKVDKEHWERNQWLGKARPW
jgi:hypothetical protein